MFASSGPLPFDPTLLLSEVPLSIYERGLAYFRAGRVLHMEIGPDFIRGWVQGSEPDPYEVEIYSDSKGRRVDSACTCPYDGGPCKHAVALALASRLRPPPRHQGGEAGTRSTRRSGAGAGEGASSAPHTLPPGRPAPHGPQPAPAGTAPPRPSWRHYLDAVLAPDDLWEPPRIGSDQVVCRLYLTDAGLEVALHRARLGKKGLGRERPLDFDPWGQYLPSIAGPLHRHLIRLLGRPATYDLRGARPDPRYRVPRPLVDACIEILGQLPFVYWDDGDEPVRVEREPLVARIVVRTEEGAVEEGPPRDGGPGAAPAAGDLVFQVQWTTPGGEPWKVPPGTPILLGHRYLWLRFGATLRPVLPAGDPRLHMYAAAGRLRIPRDEVRDFLQRYLPHVQERAALTLPPALAGRIRTDVPPRPVLFLSEDGDELVLDLRFAYGDGEPAVRATDPEPELVPGPGSPPSAWFRRQRQAEEAALQRLKEWGLEPGPDGVIRLAGEEALDFLHDRLPALAGQWEVYGEERLTRLRVAREPLQARTRLRTGIDWLDLEIELESEAGRADTQALLEALRSGSRYVRLDSGRLARLPEAWRQRAGLLVTAVEDGRPRRPRERGALRLPRWDLALAASLVELGDRRDTDETFRGLSRLAAGVDGIPPAPLPRGLQAELRPYQRRGYDWLCFLRDHGLHGVLADEMGLGKTLQVLALLLAEKEERRAREPSLVVVPTSLVFNWLEEARRFTPGLRVLALTGPGRHRLLPELDRYDLVITTYALLRRDIRHLQERRFHYVILDEAQHVKNPETQTARAIKALAGRHRLALTGTPVENRLTDLWSLFDFLMPGFLGSREGFLRRYQRLTEASTAPAGSGDDRDRVREALAALRRRIFPFILRRVKEDVARDLPPRTETVRMCDLLPAQRSLYREILLAYRQRVFAELEERGLARSRLTVLEALLKLRQVCCHPALLGVPGWREAGSAKLELFRELVGEIVAGGRRVLVFSQFVSMLDILRRELERMGIAYEYLHGRVRDREARVRRFQERDDIPVFLISLRAGGTGLNLTGASYIIHYDPWWNPAVEEQATGRAHRIGQRQPVFSYKLVTRGTVEEKILELQKRKQALAEALVVSERDLGKQLTREDLELLFSLD